jgi:oxygen-independent coproporphyrinogen III oxidase
VTTHWGVSPEPDIERTGTHVYIHVPFCGSRCVYCDFVVSLAKQGGQSAYQQAVLLEIERRWQSLPQPLAPVQTLYVGGGTPSLLPAGFYQQVIATLRRYTTLSPTAELTLEVNPGDWGDGAKPVDYLAVGFNRFSVGVQTVDPTELRKLSRRHSAELARQTVQGLVDAGASNVSVDLMYGIPCQTADSWQTTLDTVLRWPIQHVSFYGLQVEAGTPLERLVEHPAAYPLPSDEATVALYWQGVRAYQTAGIWPYEFSNAARPGFESQHNRAYWGNRDYWAFGPGAHGYVHPWRYGNTESVTGYFKTPLLAEHHWVSEAEALENALIFGLRQRWGVRMSDLIARFGLALWERFKPAIDQATAKGQLIQTHDRLTLAADWIPLSNEVFSKLMGLGG